MSDIDCFYAELGAATHFSFLRGASSPQDMVLRALQLGHAGIGIVDRNSVAGVVRAHRAVREIKEKSAEGGKPLDFRLMVGARLVFADGTPDILAYPTTRYGWGRLTRLLTTGNLRAEKGDCILRLGDLLHFHEDLQLIVLPPVSPELLIRLARKFVGRIWLGATMLRRGRDARQLAALQDQAQFADLPLIALNEAYYDGPEARPLHDILTAIREKTTVSAAGRRLDANAENHLKPPAEMARLFAHAPEAIAAIRHFCAGIHFTLDQLHYEYPHEPVPPGYTPQGWLTELVWTTAQDRWPDGVPQKLQDLLHEELVIVGQAEYAPYFLTVHDIVRFAQSRGILCQGRGSAANSAICYVLGITAVDPAEHKLLFARFISPERKEPPDIDVDFEHERREEVMQYIYKRFGRHRAGIVSTVIHYRPRSAVREVGKVLGLSEDVTARLASTVWGSRSSSYNDRRSEETGLDPDNPEILRLNHYVAQILQFPRHLSQHVGGFVLTQDRLDETVPIHNAVMQDRTFIEWDKDDIDELRLMKVDVLALGMLTCIQKAFTLIETHIGRQYRLDSVPDDAPDVFAMLHRGESVGVFQVESRAQMNMLPRLRPANFYDLAIQVAIVRPGPIQGDMVHPYLRRRQGVEAVDFPSPAPPHDPDELKNVLGKTLGVPLFQEQAMRLAITAADFSPAEANRLRRAMATFRNLGHMEDFKGKMVEGMAARGYDRAFAERCFKQIEGFGSYGFPESHALAFARLVWVSSYLKCRYPAVFAAALLNSQPMGFYAPAQIIRDARDHGVEVRCIDIQHSEWDNSLEARPDGILTLRLGLRQIGGFRKEWAERMTQSRPFTNMEQMARAADLPPRALRLLADADAYGSLDLKRRDAVWEARRTPGGELPLFAAAKARELGEEPAANLPAMALSEEVVADYQTFRLSLKEHPLTFLRESFLQEGVTACADLKNCANGAKVKVVGVVLVRQRPGKGNAIFVTLEDEDGIANVVIWARLFEHFRREVMAARLMLVEGELQRSPEGVLHVMAQRIEDRSPDLARLTPKHSVGGHGARMGEGRGMAADETRARHPRNARIIPRSRDFH
ncbi:error-prone DNA polymerase [Altericroceibacterium endophyticum]|uniref:Error-prone DNA polymerase n=1 Tax=Altericroceibacterium endophyticum TaxID=1808508 RepID=A0A6I4T5L7_9SPHN|nr:error-prone DNA polymerase [Altericroceibacterium endophyticum]MXO65210.1 DNA polymerase III subunit alpha [Altericroceibacterium endophyticum]